jgi:peptidoglycan/xylan/chitin deacetylase (PgdA/CDA1 family)
MRVSDRIVATINRGAFGLADGLWDPRLPILLFHRVRPIADTLFPDEIDAERFDRLMALIARSFNVVTLGEALSSIRRGALPPRSLVVTFDDGYADNEEVALPILARYGLAATFFVASGFLDGGLMWNDSVIENIRGCRRESIDLQSFGLGRCEVVTTSQRRAIVDALLGALKYLPPIQREEAVQRLCECAGSPSLPRRLMMSSEQVRNLCRQGMEIGAHTIHHPILARLDPMQAEAEIRDGRESLRRITDGPVDVMAYPNGQPTRDFDAVHVAIVKRLGFQGAVTTAVGAAGLDDDLFQLPRFTPWDRSPAIWSARLWRNRWRVGARAESQIPAPVEAPVKVN